MRAGTREDGGDRTGRGTVVPPLPLTPAVEHGTVSLGASSEPQEYVDGPVVFQDDFESGGRKWSATVLRPSKGGFRLDESASKAARKGVRIEKRKVRGRPSMVTVLEADEPDRHIALLPAASFKAEAYSLSADTNIGPDTGINCLITSAGPHEIVYHNHKFEYLSDVWRRVRVSFVFRVDEKSRKYCEVKFFIDGTLVDHRRDYGGQAIPGFVIDRGTAMIDNVVIYRMVPKD
jgi:hypothetical protein